MGYERKRGKLADLNSLLRGGGTPRRASLSSSGDRSAVERQVRHHARHGYAAAARRGAAVRRRHGAPAESARYDERKQRVTEGYGILQPRVAVSLPGTNRSRYARLHGGEPGIDPYTRAVSDVYQDVFGEGSFIGKGIYDVDAFERALNGRFPENRILSHDLLEGCYARAGLLSDVQLYEEYPVTLQRGREPPASLDSRRLAARRMAAGACPRVRRAPRAESAVGAVAVEDFRQPAAQPRPRGVDSPAAARLGQRCRRPGSGPCR